MTPEEILRDLRDIHLPGHTVDVATTELVLWPMGLVVALAAIALGLAWRRRTTWRRDVSRHLDAIERHAGEGQVVQGWTDLAILLRRIALRVDDRRDIAGLVGDPWLEKLDRLFGADVFCHGPGRGVVVFPYGAAMNADRERLDQAGDQLKATVAAVRKRLPNLRIAR